MTTSKTSPPIDSSQQQTLTEDELDSISAGGGTDAGRFSPGTGGDAPGRFSPSAGATGVRSATEGAEDKDPPGRFS